MDRRCPNGFLVIIVRTGKWELSTELCHCTYWDLSMNLIWCIKSHWRCWWNIGMNWVSWIKKLHNKPTMKISFASKRIIVTHGNDILVALSLVWYYLLHMLYALLLHCICFNVDSLISFCFNIWYVILLIYGLYQIILMVDFLHYIAL